MTPRSAVRHLALISLGTVLTGCAGGATRFYTVDPYPGSSAATAPYAGPPVRVDAVHLPPAMDRAELTRDLRDGRVLVSDNDHWVAPLGELMRRAVTQDLATRLPSGATIFPDAPKPANAVGVVVDILSQAHGDGAATMTVSWSLVPGRAPGTPAPSRPLQSHTLHLTTPPIGAGVAGVAAETSSLLGQLADSIAADLQATAR